MFVNVTVAEPLLVESTRVAIIVTVAAFGGVAGAV